jgi:hypothetical protein
MKLRNSTKWLIFILAILLFGHIAAFCQTEGKVHPAQVGTYGAASGDVATASASGTLQFVAPATLQAGVNYWTKMGANLNYANGNIGVYNSLPMFALDVNGEIKGTRMIPRGSGNVYGNVAVGENALNINTTGNGLVALGAGALGQNTTGFRNMAIGGSSLTANIGGQYNTAIGTYAGASSINANANTWIGDLSGYNNIVGIDNTGIGASVMVNVNGDANTGIGKSTLPNATTCTKNTVIGSFTGGGITTGSNNTIIGANIYGLSPTLTSCVIIGDGLGNQRIFTTASGQTGIGTTAPSETLHISGNIRAQGKILDNTNAAGTGDEVLSVDALGNTDWKSAPQVVSINEKTTSLTISNAVGSTIGLFYTVPPFLAGYYLQNAQYAFETRIGANEIALAMSKNNTTNLCTAYSGTTGALSFNGNGAGTQTLAVGDVLACKVIANDMVAGNAYQNIQISLTFKKL